MDGAGRIAAMLAKGFLFCSIHLHKDAMFFGLDKMRCLSSFFDTIIGGTEREGTKCERICQIYNGHADMGKHRDICPRN